MLQFTTKLMNIFSYFITTYFIPSNKNQAKMQIATSKLGSLKCN